MTTRELGRTGIHVSPIGLGCMQFSASGLLSGFFSPMSQGEADSIVKTALDGGITLFDTAELYGRGESERRLAAGLTHAGIKPGGVTVATKWPPLGRWCFSRGVDPVIGYCRRELSGEFGSDAEEGGSVAHDGELLPGPGRARFDLRRAAPGVLQLVLG